MLAPPASLDIAELTSAVASGWNIADPWLEYLAVGFGSHHWRATGRDGRRWFVTVDEHRDAGSLADLRRAFGTASALHGVAGLAFVAAPIPDATGAIVSVLGEGRFSVAATPWLDAAPLSGYGPVPAEDRPEVLRMLAALHTTTSRIDPTILLPIDLALPDLAPLLAAIAAIDEPWSSGPFGEPARALLRSDRSRLTDALARYDELVARVRSERSPWVVTHGEPHAANILRGPNGALHLIDWDTARLAPRERDLWFVIDGETDVQPYQDTGADAPVSADALRLFRMRWDLGEVAIYVAQLHAPHEDGPNTREAWENLGDYLPVHPDHLEPASDRASRSTGTREREGRSRKGMRTVTVSVAIVGAGRMGQAHVSALRDIEGVRITGVADVRPEAAEALAQRTGAKAFADYGNMLTTLTPDAVYFCTPASEHRKQVAFAAALGINVFVEKPIASTVQDAFAIADAVEEAGILCTTGYQWRSNPATDAAREALGDAPVSLVTGWWYWTIPFIPWIADRRTGGGQIFDQCTHLLDLMRDLAGDVTSVYAVYAKNARAEEELPNWDSYSLSLSFANGGVGSIASSYATFPGIAGSNGLDVIARALLIRIRLGHVTVFRRDRDPVDTRAPKAWRIDGDFIAAVRTNDPALIRSPARSAARSIAVSLAANHSATTGEIIAMPEFERNPPAVGKVMPNAKPLF